MDYSDSILNFLVASKKERDFEVIVVQVNDKKETSHKMVSLMHYLGTTTI